MKTIKTFTKTHLINMIVQSITFMFLIFISMVGTGTKFFKTWSELEGQDYFTHQALSLLNLRLDLINVDQNECFYNSREQCVTYFGLAPALIRTLPIIIFKFLGVDYYLTTKFFTLVLIIGIVIYLNRLANGLLYFYSKKKKNLQYTLYVNGFLLSTPLVFLILRHDIYQEQILFSIFLQFAILGMIVEFINKNRKVSLIQKILFLFFIFLGVNTKPTTLIFISVILLILLLIIFKGKEFISYRNVRFIYKGFIFSLIFYLTVNILKFKALSPILTTHAFIQNDALKIARTFTYGYFEPKLVIPNLITYFRFDSLLYTHEFPFIEAYGGNSELAFFGQMNLFGLSSRDFEMDYLPGLGSTTFVTLFIAILFFLKIIRSPFSWQRFFLFLVSIGAFSQTLLLFGFYGRTYRYTAEFIPGLMIASICYLILVTSKVQGKIKILNFLLGLGIVFNFYANLAIGLNYYDYGPNRDELGRTDRIINTLQNTKLLSGKFVGPAGKNTGIDLHDLKCERFGITRPTLGYELEILDFTDKYIPVVDFRDSEVPINKKIYIRSIPAWKSWYEFFSVDNKGTIEILSTRFRLGIGINEIIISATASSRDHYRIFINGVDMISFRNNRINDNNYIRLLLTSKSLIGKNAGYRILGERVCPSDVNWNEDTWGPHLLAREVEDWWKWNPGYPNLRP